MGHKYLIQICVDLLATQSLSKQAWALLNDFHRIPQILNYSCLQVAVSAIFLASRRLKIKLPDDPSWNALFGVEKNKMTEIGSLILELLSLPDFAFKHPTNIREDDDCLDCNPQTVQKQISVKQKRNKEENAKKSETKKQILRIREPVLSQKNGQNQIKTINLKKMVKSEKNKKRKRKKIKR